MTPRGLDVIALLGRVLLSAIFIQAGLHKAFGPQAAIGLMEHFGLPEPPLAYAITVAVELIGGVCVLLGMKARPAALVLAFWCIATALVAHLHPGDSEQMINFMKNLSMAGGFLQIVAFGPGRFSLGRR
jgi:putative oxidoreductase